MVNTSDKNYIFWPYVKNTNFWRYKICLVNGVNGSALVRQILTLNIKKDRSDFFKTENNYLLYNICSTEKNYLVDEQICFLLRGRP